MGRTEFVSAAGKKDHILLKSEVDVMDVSSSRVLPFGRALLSDCLRDWGF